MSKKILAAIAVLAFFVGSANCYSGDQAGTLTNADIIRMVQDRLTPNAIIERINETNQSFDLSTEAVIALKENGVPDEVLAAMLVSSARAPSGGALRPGAVSGLPGNLPVRNFGGGAGVPSLQAPSISPPDLSAPSGQGFPGMESLDLPGLPASDPLNTELSGLPAFPSLPSLPSIPGSGASAGGIPDLTPPAPVPTVSGTTPPIELTPPTPIPTGAFSAGSQDFSLPPIDDIAASDDFYSIPGTSASAVPSAARSSGDDGYEEIKSRFSQEITNIMSDSAEKKKSAVVWMLANQKYTLDFLRETMVKAPRPEQEAAAVFALGQMRDEEALPELRRRLINRNRLVRESAAEALAYMEDTDAITAAEKSLTQRVDPMDGLIRLVGHARLVRASGNLGKILADSSSPVNRVAAAWALTQLGRGATPAWPAMKKALTSDSNPDVRREAARAVASYHDDKESLKLLETSCRRDPEVRKVVIEELVAYPDSIPFLVSVINLTPDQIASDELETARASLFKLTGEDFNLDGPRWKKWLADNRTRLGLPLPAGEAAGDGKIPPGMKMGPAHLAAGRPRQVDVRSWGIVADPTEIPLAPEVDESPLPRGATQSRLPVPPPGLAGGMGGMRPPGGGSGMYDDDDDYGPPQGMFGGGAPAGMSGMGGMGMGAAGMSSPAGRYSDDSGYDAGDAPSGVRLPLPSGLLGAGGGDDAPPIPIGTRTMGSSSGMYGMDSGIGGGAAPGLTMPGSSFSGGTEAYEAPDASYSSGGYDSGFSSPSYDSYESSSTYSDSGSSLYGVSSSYGGYQDDQIVLPPTEYAPLSLDAYTEPDIIEEEIMAQSNDATGDIVSNLPLERTVGMTDMGEWTGGVVDGGEPDGYEGFAEAGEIGGEFGSEFGYSEASEVGQSAAGIPAPPTARIPAPDPDAPNVITFPGDRSSFGLGEPLFNEYGQPNAAEATELPPPTSTGSFAGGSLSESDLPPVAPLSIPVPGGQMSSGTVVEAGVEQTGMPSGMIRIPVEAMQASGLGMDAEMGMQDGFDEAGYGEYENDDFGYAEASKTGYETGGYVEQATQQYDTYTTGQEVSDTFESGGYDDGYQFDDEFDDEEYDDEYAAEASELPSGYSGGGMTIPPPPSGSGTVVTGSSVPASPPASSLHLPARKRRKQHGESAIVSHTVPGGAPTAAPVRRGVSAVVPSAVVPSESTVVLEQQAIRTGESVLVTGPARILDEDGRTTAIVMSTDDQLLPATASDMDMYIQLDDPAFSGNVPIIPGQRQQYVEARELPPAPPPGVRSEPAGTTGITVETSPSQSPGRNFRQKK